MKEQRLAAVPVLVLANKQDLANALKASDISDKLNLSDIRDRKWQIQGCSAKTGDGLHEGMEWAVKCLQ